MGITGMTWYAYLRRLAVELVLFFVACCVVFYVAGGQESMLSAINMGLVATIVYGGITYILRQRTIHNQNQNKR
jgi:hypothetical protein